MVIALLVCSTGWHAVIRSYHGMRQSLFPIEDRGGRLLVGPDSVTWRHTSDVRLNLVMLYPLLLQVAHPTVGAGVTRLLGLRAASVDRLLRTMDYLSLLVYGGRDAVAAAAGCARCTRVPGRAPDGERYSALEPEAYAWVHATLIESFVDGHAQFGRPMPPGAVERFYREYRGLGRLIGVRERDLPKDWAEFRGYFDGVVDTELERNEATDRVLRAVRHATPAPVPLPGVVWRASRIPAAR